MAGDQTLWDRVPTRRPQKRCSAPSTLEPAHQTQGLSWIETWSALTWNYPYWIETWHWVQASDGAKSLRKSASLTSPAVGDDQPFGKPQRFTDRKKLWHGRATTRNVPTLVFNFISCSLTTCHKLCQMWGDKSLQVNVTFLHPSLLACILECIPKVDLRTQILAGARMWQSQTWMNIWKTIYPNTVTKNDAIL